MKVFSAVQLHEADKVTTKKHGISLSDLMERAVFSHEDIYEIF